MSFGGRTPESLLPRSDSRNPATTCRGITSNGRPCRRPLAGSPKDPPSPSPSPGRGSGVLAVLDDQNAAAFYCWQHKDQAERLAAQGGHTRLHPLKERSSIDSLVDQMGIINLDENAPEKKKRRHQKSGISRRETLPPVWNQMESPLMTVPEEILRPKIPKRRPAPPPPRSNVKLSWSCCIQADDDDDVPPARVRRDDRNNHPRPHTRPTPSSHVTRPEMQQSSANMSTRPKPDPTPSQTQNVLSLIPPNLSPQTTSALLAELSRPISAADEAGYIYIFWLTPDSEVSKPDDETASCLLDEEDDRHLERRDTALARFASVRRPPNETREKRTVILKIGRAANVHRRMAQWTKQCGQNITLVRYYPHNSNSHSGSASPGIAGKAAHVHKVERLIHLELSDKRVMKSDCPQCGREHREWFEIEATKEGLRCVDEVVRRWVGWAERQQVPIQQSQYY